MVFQGVSSNPGFFLVCVIEPEADVTRNPECRSFPSRLENHWCTELCWLQAQLYAFFRLRSPFPLRFGHIMNRSSRLQTQFPILTHNSTGLFFCLDSKHFFFYLCILTAHPSRRLETVCIRRASVLFSFLVPFFLSFQHASSKTFLMLAIFENRIFWYAHIAAISFAHILTPSKQITLPSPSPRQRSTEKQTPSICLTFNV